MLYVNFAVELFDVYVDLAILESTIVFRPNDKV